MLQTLPKDKRYNCDQLYSISSPSSSIHRSNLTAALQDLGNGSALSRQLSPTGQVDDLAGQGENNIQSLSTVNTALGRSNWKYVVSYCFPSRPKTLTKSLRPNHRSIEPFPKCNVPTNNKLQFDPWPGSNTGTWSHSRAFSVPEADVFGGWGRRGGGFEALQSSSPGFDVTKSFEGGYRLRRSLFIMLRIDSFLEHKPSPISILANPELILWCSEHFTTG